MNLQKHIQMILEDCPVARDSDRILMDVLFRKIYGDNYLAMSARAIILNGPSFETIRRARQKIQSEHPELGPSENVKKVRKELEGEWKQWAMS